MRIATMATGGIGGYLAVHLSRAGHEVATIARGPHLEAIRAKGLTLRAPEGTLTATPWRATEYPAEVGPVDAIIFGVKGDGLAGAAELCRPMIGPETVLVPFLNGVEAADRLVRILGESPVANGVAYVSTTIEEPGLIGQTGTMARFAFAERDSRPSARIDRLRAALSEAGVNAPAVEDIEAEVWRKFILFSAMSGVTAAGRCRLGDVRANPALAALYRRVMSETAGLARACGIAIEEGFEDVLWERAQALPPEMRATTAVDIEAGRPVETHWINGAVVRLAEPLGLPVPANQTIHALLSPHIATEEAKV